MGVKTQGQLLHSGKIETAGGARKMCEVSNKHT